MESWITDYFIVYYKCDCGNGKMKQMCSSGFRRKEFEKAYTFYTCSKYDKELTDIKIVRTPGKWTPTGVSITEEDEAIGLRENVL